METEKDIKLKQRIVFSRPHRMHPNSLANLKPIKQGSSALNPAGRPPKDVSITSIVKVLLQAPTAELPWPKENLTWGQALALSWVKRAMTEDVAFREILERVEGKVITPIAVNIRAELERVAVEMGVPVAEVEAEYQTVVKLLPRGQ